MNKSRRKVNRFVVTVASQRTLTLQTTMRQKRGTRSRRGSERARNTTRNLMSRSLRRRGANKPRKICGMMNGQGNERRRNESSKF